VSPFFNSWLPGIIISIAVMQLSACGGDESGPVSPTPRTATGMVKAPPVMEWYPAPKHQHRPQYFMPDQAPSQSRQPRVTTQSIQQQPVWGGGYVQPVPQPWVAPSPPVAGYGAVPGVPAQGGMYVPVPAWGQYGQPAQPVQQQNYPLASQYPYAQRPWGAADARSNSKRAGQSINTWQLNNELPAWGMPSNGGYPSQAPGYDRTRQQVVQPQYYW
jgi:hypothetical protein